MTAPIWPPWIHIDPKEGEWYSDKRKGRIPYKRTSFRFVSDNPEADIVWLEPRCMTCEDGLVADLFDDKTYCDRTYCEDDVYDFCPGDDCNKRAWPYRRETNA